MICHVTEAVTLKVTQY